jgi:hypothetical protein
VSPTAWARLSGAARFSATEPVTGGRPNVSPTRDALPVTLRQGVSPVLCFRLELLGRFLVVPADRVVRVTASRPA